MAYQIQSPRVLPILEIEKGLSFMISVFHWRRRASSISFTSSPYPMKSFQMRRPNWKIAFALDTGSSVPGDSGGGQEMNGDRSGLGSTRLGRIAIAGGKQLLGKINSARKNFPMKIFMLLLGFLLQMHWQRFLDRLVSGDWDVLVAEIVVAAIEGIGMLMYKRTSSSMFSGKLQSFVVL